MIRRATTVPPTSPKGIGFRDVQTSSREWDAASQPLNWLRRWSGPHSMAVRVRRVNTLRGTLRVGEGLVEEALNPLSGDRVVEGGAYQPNLRSVTDFQRRSDRAALTYNLNDVREPMRWQANRPPATDVIELEMTEEAASGS